MKSKKTQDFNAVDFMRRRRKVLSELYNSNPQEFKKYLKEVQKNIKASFG